jgi:putative spermidine/putrescine transport system permease protein
MTILENMLLKNKYSNRAGIICLWLLVLLPFAAGFVYSVLYAFGLTGVLSTGFTNSHAAALLRGSELFSSLLYSLYIAATSIFIAVSIALTGVLIFKTAITTSRWAIVPLLPLALPAIVTAFVSLMVFSKTGLLARLSHQAGITSDPAQFPDMVNDRFGIGIIATHVLMAVPFLLMYFANLYQAQNLPALAATARTLGASRRHTAQKILLPLLLTKGRNTLLLYFIFVFGTYEIPLVLGQQNPQMIAVLIVRKMQRYNLLDIPQGYFLSVAYTLVVVLLLALFLKPQKQPPL